MASRGEQSGRNLSLATFRFDVTPPIGHPLCGGWIEPVAGVDDSLEAIGLVVLGAEKPIVICAVDWTGLSNDAHVQWRTALAKAADTTPDRVAVQCVHQHNAPFACLEAERIVQAEGDLPHIVDVDFYRRCLEHGQKAVSRAIPQARPLTHVAHGQAKVDKVASNRRVFRDESGQIITQRSSCCDDDRLRILPEGPIDPWLKTVAFYHNETRIAACHYYATHPMSYYGDGRVSSDFVGLARKQRQQEDVDCVHLYFTGCAGDIAAGKYNDGSKAMRAVLTDRIYRGIVSSEKNLQPAPIENVEWKTCEFVPSPRDTLCSAELQQKISTKSNAVVDRNRSSYMLAWLRRLEQQVQLTVSSLRLNNIQMLHLPAECFIQYQLRAQQICPSGFVATAAYGDGGPWYIPVEEEYTHGGYEVSMAFGDPRIDSQLTSSMQQVLEFSL